MLPGEMVAERFELEALAQAGGMGAVYRARDRLNGERVAVKLLHEAGDGQRFLREAALLAELRHPAIVRHVAHGRTATGELYLAMEWLDGEDLAQRIARGPLSADDTIAIVRRIADALALLHDRGGLHRDLKPSNLFLEGGRADRAKLLDFGVARAAAVGVTRTGTIMGTPGYTAPEQARGVRDLDARADVFALGCVMYECLTGRPAFKGDHPMAVLARILLEDPPRLAEVSGAAPPVLDAIVSRMLAKDPARRPRDGGELRDLLDGLGPQAIAAGARPIGPLTPRPPTLGPHEQRFMCLVLCTMPDAQAIGQDVTLVPSGADPTLTPDVAPSPQHLATLVRSHGARLERLADGSWVALPDRGAHAPATDQAAQAARVALALARALPGARIAIAAGRGVQAGRSPVGDVIDRAVGLVAARAHGIAIDKLSAGLLASGFVLREEGDRALLVGEQLDPEPERRVLGKIAPCVGRDRELATLVGTFEECVAEPCARAVIVRGPAGYGKSRLRVELLRRLRAGGIAFEWLYARGDPLRAGAPFAMAAQVVRRAAEVVDGEPAPARRARLSARVAETVAPADRERVTAFLAEMIHASSPDEESGPLVEAARRDPMMMGDHVRRAWEDWLAAETARRPVVLVLEDLHLGDLSTVKLVDLALRNLRERPLYVVALARPELELAFPGLWSERGAITIPLPELSRRASQKMVRELLESEPDAVVDRIVQQAGGNAFYLEELCRVVRDGHAGELPGTVLAMAQARLESLDAASRRLLRAASVFGARFPRGGALALGGDDDAAAVDRMLADLVEVELLDPAPAEFRDERSYAFRHPLVREAAYAMLTDADRRLGHRLAAEWLIAAGATDQVLLAEHFERGGVHERAIAGYLAAARDALEGNDLAAVLGRVERGLACGARGAELGELLMLRAEALRWRAESHAAHETAVLAMAALPAGSASWCMAATTALTAIMAQDVRGRVDELLAKVEGAPPIDPPARLRTLCKFAVHLYLTGRYERADVLLAQVERAAGADPLLEAQLLETRSFREAARGDQGTSLGLLERATAAYLAADDLRSACMARNNVGYTLIQLGQHARAASLLEGALADAEQLGIAFASVILRHNLAVAIAGLGQRDRAEQLLRQSSEEYKAQRDAPMASLCRVHLAKIWLEDGRAAAAVREAEAALDGLVTNPTCRVLGLAVLARAKVACGQPAIAIAREAYGILEALGSLDEGELLVRVALAEALAAGDRDDEARAVVQVAITRVGELAAHLSPELAASFRTVGEIVALDALAARL
ncbi:MAG TPA: protein kinase [Kofleriaceae bacterium]|nr:protein kinase [Kofleriaceae bacterium]